MSRKNKKAAYRTKSERIEGRLQQGLNEALKEKGKDGNHQPKETVVFSNWHGEKDVFAPNLTTSEIYEGETNPLVGLRVAVARGDRDLSTVYINKLLEEGKSTREITAEVKKGIRQWSRGPEKE
ncbi:MAG: hypothetical protein Q8P10_00050 [bacterium]|nr:hypothetical protein [bacterium]